PATRRKNLDAATKYLQTAISKVGHNYPWALLYLASVRFVSALDRVAVNMDLDETLLHDAARTYKTGRVPLEVIPGELKIVSDFVLSTYAFVLQMYQDHMGSKYIRTGVQPGAVARDQYFALTNDLLDFTASITHHMRRLISA